LTLAFTTLTQIFLLDLYDLDFFWDGYRSCPGRTASGLASLGNNARLPASWSTITTWKTLIAHVTVTIGSYDDLAHGGLGRLCVRIASSKKLYD